jgi:hypothetical protein
MVTAVVAFSANAKFSVLHRSVSASTYMCWPVSVPQTTGGFEEGLGPVTPKESAWQLVACVEPKYSTVNDPAVCPNRLFNSRVSLVLGPVMTKVVKSSRIEQISSLIGQTVSEHEPAETVDGCVQYVRFSEVDEPHVVIRNVQQTPNPSAHEPELVPPLSEHSALV